MYLFGVFYCECVCYLLLFHGILVYDWQDSRIRTVYGQISIFARSHQRSLRSANYIATVRVLLSSDFLQWDWIDRGLILHKIHLHHNEGTNY